MAEHHKFCIVVGAGVGGLVQAAELLRQKVLQTSDIHIFEHESDYGGVWKAATYPGAACDVFSCLYQISWHRNPNWNSLFPKAAELVAYYKLFADHYNLPLCTSFNRTVIQATWSAERSLWLVDVEDLTTNMITRWTANVLIEAAGTYNRKSIPEMPGIETFKGDTWHTADWPEGYDFTGKTVAYVGTGPTSVQVLPHIQKQAKAVKVFCRSMTYCHPFVDFTYPSWIKWCFGHIPGLFALCTTIIASLFGIWAWFAFRPDSWIAKYTERYCQNVLEKQVHDPILRRKLAPTGRFGAKRPLVSLKEYFNVLQEDNVELITDAIIGVDESGLITRATLKPNDAVIDVDGYSGSDEERAAAEIFCVKADVLIWGTGFKMQGWGGAVRTMGRNGIELSEHWEDSPKTLYGTMTSSFPNLFLVNGPNTVSPWASLIRGLEHQTMHNLRVIRHVHKQVTSTTANYAIEPHTEKEKEWTEDMQTELNKLATSAEYGPAFYYLSKSGRNTFFWPWPQRWYWWRTRTYKVEEYVVLGDEKNGKHNVSA